MNAPLIPNPEDSKYTNFGYLGTQLAAVAALCIQYEADFRPNMTIVVKALRPLVNARTSTARTESQAN